MDTPDLDPQHILERAQHTYDETLRRADEMRARREAERAAHAAQMAEMDALRERNQETLRRLDELVARKLDTTVAQVRRMTERETHPTWMHAAYADVAQRLAQMERRLEDIEESLRMIIGQLATQERQERDDT